MSAAGSGLALPGDAVDDMWARLPGVAAAVVEAVTEEVPSYEGALAGPMGDNIREAVQLALGGFLSLAAERDDSDPRTPAAPAVEGAYQLGRGEARSGRTTDALLAAYRIGARVAWRELSTAAVRAGVPAQTLVPLAELVFAYIDELSAASVAGHADETTTTGRVRQRLLERVAQLLLDGSSPEVVVAAAERAGWEAPSTLTAVLVPESQVRSALAALPQRTLVTAELPDLGDDVLLLVPDMHDGRRAVLLRALADRDAATGPARPWLQVRPSYERVVRARGLGLSGDTDAHLVQLLLQADPETLADLRAQALAPLADLRPATAEKLAETLRAWLLHQGRRDDVAASLFVHPQTVRYRMGQLRELYGDRLDDPAVVLQLAVALGADRP